MFIHDCDRICLVRQIVHNSANLPPANLPTATKNPANLKSFLINGRIETAFVFELAMMNEFEEQTCNCTGSGVFTFSYVGRKKCLICSFYRKVLFTKKLTSNFLLVQF